MLQPLIIISKFIDLLPEPIIIIVRVINIDVKLVVIHIGEC